MKDYIIEERYRKYKVEDYLEQIKSFINYSNCNNLEEVKQNLFKITIKALLEDHVYEDKILGLLDTVFEGNISDFYDNMQWNTGLQIGVNIKKSFNKIYYISKAI